MGVPKFFRWLGERYPLILQSVNDPNTVIRRDPSGGVDNFYLDINGILHTCAKPDDSPAPKALPDTEVFIKSFTFIDKLVGMVKPRKRLFLGIDGVAPRAKVNQQRKRRFKSMKTARLGIQKEGEAGLLLTSPASPNGIPEDRFDGNCITPGTDFMAKLDKHMRYFLHKKMSGDNPLWNRLEIIYSGPFDPGEGEHKIMDFIRTRQAESLNEHHCVFGLDADLLMLGLITHCPKFTLLRRIVEFGPRSMTRGGRKHDAPMFGDSRSDRYLFCHLHILREYFDVEFKSALLEVTPDAVSSPSSETSGSNTIPTSKFAFTYDLERIVDDWVFMCMFIGNDFLPGLNGVDIRSNCMGAIFNGYKHIVKETKQYLTHASELNLPVVEKFIQHTLTPLETQFYKNSTGQASLDKIRPFDGDTKPPVLWKPLPTLSSFTDSQLQAEKLFNPHNQKPSPYGEFPTGLDVNKKLYNNKYYIVKCPEYKVFDIARAAIVEEYIKGLRWVMDYYYKGCPSWSWFYPFHFPPLCCDLVDLAKFSELKFKLDKPLLPTHQLLFVLPPGSFQLLPKAYHSSVLGNNTALRHWFPHTFNIDLNGKKMEWEGVALIPFIDSENVMPHVQKLDVNLDDVNRQKNTRIHCVKITRDPNASSTVPSPATPNTPFSRILSSFKSCTIETRFHLPRFGDSPGLVCHPKLANSSVLITVDKTSSLQFSKFTPDLGRYGLLPFGSKSRYDSIILTPTRPIENICGLNSKTIASDIYRFYQKSPVFGKNQSQTLLPPKDYPINPNLSAFHLGPQLLGKTFFAEWPYTYSCLVVGIEDGYHMWYVDNKGQTTMTACPDPDNFIRRVSKIKSLYFDKKGIQLDQKIDWDSFCGLSNQVYPFSGKDLKEGRQRMGKKTSLSAVLSSIRLDDVVKPSSPSDPSDPSTTNLQTDSEHETTQSSKSSNGKLPELTNQIGLDSVSSEPSPISTGDSSHQTNTIDISKLKFLEKPSEFKTCLRPYVLVHIIPLVGVDMDRNGSTFTRLWPSSQAIKVIPLRTLMTVDAERYLPPRFRAITRNPSFKLNLVNFLGSLTAPVLYIGHLNYAKGNLAKIVAVDASNPANITVDLEFTSLSESVQQNNSPIPSFFKIYKFYLDKFYPMGFAAKMLDTTPSVLGRIIGSLTLDRWSHDIGLHLRYKLPDGDMLIVPGFTAFQKGHLMLSDRAINLINDYKFRFPTLFHRLDKNMRSSSSKDIFVDRIGKKAPEFTAHISSYSEKRVLQILTYLHSLKSSKMSLTTSNTQSMSVEAIEKVVQGLKADRNRSLKQENSVKKGSKRLRLSKIPLKSLYLPILGSIMTTRNHNLHLNTKARDPPSIIRNGFLNSMAQWFPTRPISESYFYVGAFVSYIQTHLQIPFGMKGVVVQLSGTTAHVVLHHPIVGAETLGGRLNLPQGIVCSISDLVLLSCPKEKLPPRLNSHYCSPPEIPESIFTEADHSHKTILAPSKYVAKDIIDARIKLGKRVQSHPQYQKEFKIYTNIINNLTQPQKPHVVYPQNPNISTISQIPHVNHVQKQQHQQSTVSTAIPVHSLFNIGNPLAPISTPNSLSVSTGLSNIPIQNQGYPQMTPQIYPPQGFQPQGFNFGSFSRQPAPVPVPVQQTPPPQLSMFVPGSEILVRTATNQQLPASVVATQTPYLLVSFDGKTSQLVHFSFCSLLQQTAVDPRNLFSKPL